MLQRTDGDLSLLTFGQLLRLKREQKNLSLDEAKKKIPYWQLSETERDLVSPSKRIKLRLIAFYKITEEELSSLKIPGKSVKDKPNLELVKNAKPKKIESIVNSIHEIIEEVKNMDEKGIYAKKLKSDCLEALRLANEQLCDVVILDRLL